MAEPEIFVDQAGKLHRLLAARDRRLNVKAQREEKRRQFFAVAEIAHRLAGRAFEAEVQIAVLGALAFEAIVGLDHGLHSVQWISDSFDFIVEIEIHEHPLQLKAGRSPAIRSLRLGRF
jgi:hypothetical protein